MTINRVIRGLGVCYHRSVETSRMLSQKFSRVRAELPNPISQKSQQVIRTLAQRLQQSSTNIPRLLVAGIAGSTASLFLFNTLYAEEKSAVETPEEALKTQMMKCFFLNPLGWPAFHYALRLNDSEIAKRILKLHPEQATLVTPPEQIKALVVNGTLISEHRNGTSALELAVKKGDPKLVKQLLEHGANPNENHAEYTHIRFSESSNYLAMTQTRHSILYWALERNNQEIVDLLVSHGANGSECYRSEQRVLNPNYVRSTQSFFWSIMFKLWPEDVVRYYDIKSESASQVARRMDSQIY